MINWQDFGDGFLFGVQMSLVIVLIVFLFKKS